MVIMKDKKYMAQLKKAKSFYEKGMNFSSLKYWEIVLQSNDSTYNRLMYADQLRLCGMYEESELKFLELNQDQIPENKMGMFFSCIGQLYLDQHKIQQAREYFEKWLIVENNSTVPYIFLSLTLQGENLNEDAIKLLTSGLNKEGDVDEIYFNLATRLAIKGDFNSALSMVNECLLLASNYPNARLLQKDLTERINFISENSTDIFNTQNPMPAENLLITNS
jgi:tetratricopeptide (TPR) repeat protein